MKDSTIMFIFGIIIFAASIFTSGDLSHTLITLFSVLYVGGVILKNIENK